MFCQLRLIETHLNAVRLCASDLFHELFLANVRPLPAQHFPAASGLGASPPASFATSNALHKLAHIFDNLHLLHRKHM